MLKSISKIAIVLFITFLLGLVMTDSVLPDIQSEERAEIEIEIEEEEEIEVANLIQSEFVTTIENGGGKNKISDVQIDLESKEEKTLFYSETKTITSYNTTLSLATKTPLYILYCVLKLNL